MKRLGIISLSAALAAAMALGPVFATQETPAPDIRSEANSLNSTETVSIESAIDQLRKRRGYSFVYDSRIISGKTVTFGRGERITPASLGMAIGAAGLELRIVSSNVFAIRAAEKIAASPAPFDEIRSEAPQVIDTILVLGSASTASASLGSKHIFDIDADELAYLSIASPAEAIYNLPQSLASFTPSNTALFGATAGISLADLRGLDPKRTMVLVNGRRRTIMTGGNGAISGVDLNSIAEPLLERIEVQNLPGGARYGSGAVAGVINFVTRTDFIGFESGARFGISEYGDSEQLSLHAIGGREVGANGNLTLGFNLTRSEGIIGADRPFSATPYGFARDGRKSSPAGAVLTPGFGGSATTERGAFGGVILADGSFAPLPGRRTYLPNPDGSIEPFVAELDQLYNYAAWQNVVLPNDRLLGVASFATEIADEWRAFIDLSGGLSATDNKLAPLPATRSRGVNPVVGDAAIIPFSNPFLPQSIKDLATSAFGASVSGVVFDHRYEELGPRRHQIDRRYLDLTAGIEGTLADAAELSLTYRYANNRVVTRDADRIDRNRLQIALDPAQCAAAADCTLVDFFTTPEISPAALDYIVIPEIRRSTSVAEHEVALAATTPLRFADLDDGRLSAGIELRRTILTDSDDVPAGTAPIGFLGGADNRADVDTFEAYVEIETPLARFEGPPGEFDGSLAFRTVKSSQFDYSMNFEASIDWRPVEGVQLFTRQHIGERTPDILELFTVSPSNEATILDPCGLPAAQQSLVVQANCASNGPLGVGVGFVQASPLATYTAYGNPDLKPEQIRSAAYGVSLTPEKLLPAISGRMQLSAIWFDFEINDAISDSYDVIAECYSSPGLTSPACGQNPRTGEPIIVRDPVTRQIVSTNSVLQNGGGLDWSGLDLELRYSVQPDFLGGVDSIWLSALHTYTHRVRQSNFDGSTEQLEGLIDFPKHRTLMSAGIGAGRWNFVLFGTRRGRVLTERVPYLEARVPPAFYLDATVRFDVTDSAYVQASVKNLTDKEPAITAFNELGNFAPEYYDPIGRRYALSIRVNF